MSNEDKKMSREQSEALKLAKEQSKMLELSHDGFAKTHLKKVEVGRSLCEAHIPLEYREKLGMDLSALSVMKTEYQTTHFKGKVADAVYRVPTRTRDSIVIVHMEHQSTAQRHMPLRMLETMIAIIRDEIGNNHQNTEDLPLVIPIILYAGRGAYRYSTSFMDCFEESQRGVLKDLLTHPFKLVDLTQISDEELRQHAHAALMEVLLKRVQQDDEALFLLEYAVHLIEEALQFGFLTIAEACQSLKEVVCYLSSKAKLTVSEAKVGEFFEALETKVEGPLGETLMTLRDHLVNLGHAAGRDEITHNIAINLLKKDKLDLAEIAEVSELSLADVLKLQADLNKKL